MADTRPYENMSPGDGGAPVPAGRALFVLALLTAGVYITRAPFLGAGYGNDTDAWLVAGAARTIAQTGQYIASRLPCYPVQELACSLFWWGGPLLLNGITALLSALAVALFAMTFIAAGSKRYLSAATALAFTPVFYINSTVSMDYIWALAFIVAALCLAARGRPLASGLLLGLAVGCRITSGAMIIPLVILLAGGPKPRAAIRRIVPFIISALLVSVLCYLPPFLTYGFGFFDYYKVAKPSLVGVVKGATEDIWGTIGLIAIAVALVYQVVVSIRGSKVGSPAKEKLSPPLIAASLAAVLIYAVAYLLAPYEPEYLLPAVPFAILLLSAFLDRRAFILVSAGLAISPFFLSFGRLNTDDFVSTYQWRSPVTMDFSLGGKPYFVDAAGPIISDYNRRLRGVRYIEYLVEAGRDLEGKNVIVVGRWIGPVALLGYEDLHPNSTEFGRFLRALNDPRDIPAYFRFRSRESVVYEHWLSEEMLQSYRDAGYTVHYSADYLEANKAVTGLDLKEAGAQPLPIPD